MNRLDKIKKMAEDHDSLESKIARRVDLQNRLRALNHEYGSEEVAAATGYTDKTLSQLLRVKEPPMINELTVIKAERILNSI